MVIPFNAGDIEETVTGPIFDEGDIDKIASLPNFCSGDMTLNAGDSEETIAGLISMQATSKSSSLAIPFNAGYIDETRAGSNFDARDIDRIAGRTDFCSREMTLSAGDLEVCSAETMLDARNIDVTLLMVLFDAGTLNKPRRGCRSMQPISNVPLATLIFTELLQPIPGALPAGDLRSCPLGSTEVRHGSDH